jgi:organic hydroperoxide reductase OsmC/OhrA
VPIARAGLRVRGEFWEEGSVLRDTVEGGCTGISLELSIESSADDGRIARLVRNAERLCFVEQTVVNRTPVTLSVVHDGNRLDAMSGPGER